MNTAIILAGGVGSRMGVDRPKQFLMVQDKPIISYCFDIFQKHSEIDAIVVVVSEQWQSFVEEYAAKYHVDKICGYAPAGKTRQHSIYNGLKCIAENAPDDEALDECRKLVDNLRARKPVIINLERVETDLARKMFDFLGGATYALQGTVQRINPNIYIFAPNNVNIKAMVDRATEAGKPANANPWK